MKTKEELNALKKEVEAVSEKLAELTPEEVAQVSGGVKHRGLIKYCTPGLTTVQQIEDLR